VHARVVKALRSAKAGVAVVKMEPYFVRFGEILVKSFRELVEGGRHLQTLVQHKASALKAHILRPSYESVKVLLGRESFSTAITTSEAFPVIELGFVPISRGTTRRPISTSTSHRSAWRTSRFLQNSRNNLTVPS
jgi:hypothetical protein